MTKTDKRQQQQKTKGNAVHENRKKLGFTSTELEMKEPFKKHYNIDMF